MRQPKVWHHNRRAGCVAQQRSRVTGHLYGMYHAEQAGLDPAAGPWACVCEDHGTILNLSTWHLARTHLPAGEWCEQCQTEQRQQDDLKGASA